MTLAPLIDAGPLIAVHALAAGAALLLGPFVILRRRRDRLHRGLGMAWVGTMVLAALCAVLWRAQPQREGDSCTARPLTPSVRAAASLWEGAVRSWRNW